MIEGKPTCPVCAGKDLKLRIWREQEFPVAENFCRNEWFFHDHAEGILWKYDVPKTSPDRFKEKKTEYMSA